MFHERKIIDLDQFLLELDDPEPIVRQDAAIALGDYCREDHPCIDVLIDRLRSSDQTHHDRACAAWALGRIKRRAGEVVAILLMLFDQFKDQTDADELRSFAGESIERLTDDIDILSSVAKHFLKDSYWSCRMSGLFLVERLLKRQPDLREGFLPLIQSLMTDEVGEIRDHSRRLLIQLEEDV
jgi:hypothetical protein